MPYIRCDGEEIYYVDRGSGEPIVWIHSLGAAHQTWAPQLEAFSSAYRCLALDCRAHGLSSCRGEVSVAAMADDVRCLLDAVGADAAHLVGCSMGGVIAQAFALRHPHRVRSVVLADTFAGMDAATAEQRIEERRRALEAITDMDEYARQRVDTLLRRDAPEESRRAFFEAARLMDKENFLKAAQALYSVDFRGSLGRIACPTLVLIGEDDDRTPMSMAQELAAGIPGARLAIVPAAGHLANLDNPSEFNRIVAEFLGGLGG